MSETSTKLDKMIELQEKTLEEIKGLEKQVKNVEERQLMYEKDFTLIKVETAKNTKSIKYQWWIMTFIGFLIIIIFANF